MYVPGARNAVADVLSRTLFKTEDCEPTGEVLKALDILEEEDPRWVWKDGKGGFEEFLKGLDCKGREEVIEKGTLEGVGVFM